jgi:hypothetical protein
LQFAQIPHHARSEMLPGKAGRACEADLRRQAKAGSDQHSHGQPKDGAAMIPSAKYVEIRPDTPQPKEPRDWSEYERCK